MSTDIEQELERTVQIKGFRYGLHDFLAYQGGAEALKKHNDHSMAGYLKEGPVDRKTKELLMMVAIVAQGGLVSHMQIHMHAACKAGATPEEVLAALTLVGDLIGATRKIVGLEAWRATFRSDIPTIDRVVELR